MKIAVNTRLLVPNKLEGIGWFTFETLRRIVPANPQHEFIFLFDRPFSSEYIFSQNIKPLVLQPQARHPFLWYLFFEHGIGKALRSEKPDLFLSPDGFLNLATKVPSVAAIHDIAFEHFPEQVPFFTRKYYRHFFPKFAAKAKRIATVSEFSKQDIVKTYGADASKIDVVYNGANTIYRPVNQEIKELIRNSYADGAPYFVFIGGMYPRKNLKRLILAFDEFKKRKPTNIKLLIIGQNVWGTEEVFEAHKKMQFAEDVKFLGRINSTEEVGKILASALAMTYVSVFEGFGIPVLEALHCAIPVITSNTSSMPEVAGAAACYADPYSVDSIADAMQKMAYDTDYRNQLIAAGIEQKQKFSWDKTAELLWKCVEKAM